MEPVTVDDRLLAFQGYGHTDAPLWLLGIEEGFGGRLSNPGWTVQRELDARALWGEVQDTRAAGLALNDHYWERRNYSRVWRNAAKLARALVLHSDDWLDTDRAHEYVISRLGRTAGEIFLGELFPLPAVGLEHWPYGSRWIARDIYRTSVWPDRRTLWQRVLANSPTKLVICYGTDVRRYACELFGCPARSGIYSHYIGDRRIVFAPFIGGRASNEVLRAIVTEARG